jgi:hypothetical protein
MTLRKLWRVDTLHEMRHDLLTIDGIFWAWTGKVSKNNNLPVYAQYANGRIGRGAPVRTRYFKPDEEACNHQSRIT